MSNGNSGFLGVSNVAGFDRRVDVGALTAASAVIGALDLKALAQQSLVAQTTQQSNVSVAVAGGPTNTWYAKVGGLIIKGGVLATAGSGSTSEVFGLWAPTGGPTFTGILGSFVTVNNGAITGGVGCTAAIGSSTQGTLTVFKGNDQVAISLDWLVFGF